MAIARWRWGIAAAKPRVNTALRPALYAFSASSEGVVACSSGVECSSMEDQRLAQPRPDLNRNPRKCIQDVFFSFRLHLLLAKNVSGAAVPGAQPHHVPASEAGNRAFQDSRAAPVLSQISCAISGVRRVSGGRSIKRSICWIC